MFFISGFKGMMAQIFAHPQAMNFFDLIDQEPQYLATVPEGFVPVENDDYDLEEGDLVPATDGPEGLPWRVVDLSYLHTMYSLADRFPHDRKRWTQPAGAMRQKTLYDTWDEENIALKISDLCKA